MQQKSESGSTGSKIERPETAYVVQPGLDKSEEYQSRTELVPVYVLAMGMSSIAVIVIHSYIVKFSCQSFPETGLLSGPYA